MKWLFTDEVSELTNKTVRAVRKLYPKKYPDLIRYINAVGGNSGKVLQIHLSALPEDAQRKYYANKHNAPLPDTDILKDFFKFTDAQRVRAELKMRILAAWDEAIAHEVKTISAFCEEFNAVHKDHALYPVKVNDIKNWKHQLKKHGIVGLVDKRGGYNKGESSIPKAQQDTFKYFWLDESQPTVQYCYNRVLHAHKGEYIPSIKAFERLSKSIPLPYITYHREGEKAFDDKHMPHMERNINDYAPNEIWIGDHHLFDFFCINKNGKKVRLWLTAWSDMHSRLITGYIAREQSPSSDVVMDSFIKAATAYGVPDGVTIDNGKDYKTHDIFNAEFDMSLSNALGITVTNAIPYNAKAKAIERVFNTFENQFGKGMTTYAGRNAQKRPERLKKMADEDYPTVEEAIKAFDDYIKDYNTTPHTGKGMGGKTPKQVYNENLINKREIPKEVIEMYFLRTLKPRTVQRQGVWVKFESSGEGYWFKAPELFTMQGQQVYIRYNQNDIGEVYIFSLEGTFICIATARELYGKGVTKEDYREFNKEKKAYKKAAKQYKPVVEAATFTEYLSDRRQDIESREQQPDATPNVIPIINSSLTQAAQKKKEHDQRKDPDKEVKLPTPQRKNNYPTEEIEQFLMDGWNKRNLGG